MNVLIIDDERAIRRALREILEFEKCQVFEAENGKEGIDYKSKKFRGLKATSQRSIPFKWRTTRNQEKDKANRSICCS